MLQLHNRSPFEAQMFGIPDRHGIDMMVVVVKATFTIAGSVAIAAEQDPVALADEYWGDPASTSLRLTSEIHTRKVGTDVLVIGEACAPGERPVTELRVAAGVGDHTQQATVHGDRFWTEGVGGIRPTSARPFVRVPLTYEHAFGGRHVFDPDNDRFVDEPRNPVGRGFRGKRSTTEMLGQPVPNIDDPRHPLTMLGQSPQPVGFGPLAPSWEARRRYAGTYDDVWRRKRAPYLPEDFDPRFLSTAPQPLRFQENLKGGEPVATIGMHPSGPQRFALPRCQVEVKVRVSGEAIRSPSVLETVVLQPTREQFSMTWRSTTSLDKRMLAVERVDVTVPKLEGVAETSSAP
ncbi:MAG: DUF2169 domain-containing protein [Deltaproteobacteria bacterium]|nr:DUF2169 domain-containing protein [Deltaproteobacteria bacterium]